MKTNQVNAGIYEKNASRVSAVSTIFYGGLKKIDGYADAYVWQRQVFDAKNGWNNDPVSDGMILSPYLTLRVNGLDFPVYAARATFSAHSFAYAEVEETGDFSLAVSLRLTQKRNAVVVLPESSGVKARISGDFDVEAEITKTGSFTFVFEHYVEGAFTLFVRRKKPFVIPDGYEETVLSPGRHTAAETAFGEKKRVYRFRRGEHFIERILLPSDSVLFLEDGAILHAEYDPAHEFGEVVGCRGAENVSVCGKGAFDYSALPNGKRKPFDFYDCRNVAVRDVTLINSDTWSVCFTACRGVVAEDLLAIAYRMWSDGIMLSDCTDGLVQNCFLRTGDDAAEVKSTSDTDMRTDNILFRNVDVWTDKGCGFGVVFECNHDTRNVRFENCSVGFALPNWSKHLGCLTVNTGNNSGAVDYDIFFGNIEIYYTLCSAISICAYEGAIRDVRVENVKVKYSFHEAPVFVWLRDKDKASIGKIYLDGVVVNNIPLDRESEKRLVAVEAPEGSFDRSEIVIGSRGKGVRKQGVNA